MLPASFHKNIKGAGAVSQSAVLAVLLFAGCGERIPDNGTAGTPSIAKPSATLVDWPMFRGDSALTGVAQGELAVPLRLLWNFKTGGPVNSSAVVADGRVFTGSGDDQVYALDLKSGAKLWSFKTGGPVEAPPLALNGRVFVGSQDGNLYALDAATGTQIWKHATGEKIIGSANWFVTRGTTNLLVGSYDYMLHCVDAATGRSYGHYENEFQCVNLRTGTKTWTFHDRNFPYFSSPAITTNRIVFGGRDKLLHCVNRADGKPLWQFATRGKVDSSPVVCGDKVIVGSDDGRVYVVSLNDGKELWSYEIGQPVGSSPAIAAGKIIVGSDDGSVYCFGNP